MSLGGYNHVRCRGLCENYKLHGKEAVVKIPPQNYLGHSKRKIHIITNDMKNGSNPYLHSKNISLGVKVPCKMMKNTKENNNSKRVGCKFKAKLQLSSAQNSEQSMTSIFNSLSTPFVQ